MNRVKHFLLNELFLTAVSLASLAHSTAILALFFGGSAPEYPAGGWLDIGYMARLAYHYLPAFAVALSIDVGLLSVSQKLKAGRLTYWQLAANLLTFGVFSFLIFVTNHIYLAMHIPEVTLGEGVRAAWLPVTELLRDSTLFLLPASLPIAMMLYTLGAIDGGSDEPVGNIAKLSEQKSHFERDNELIRVNPPHALPDSLPTTLATSDLEPMLSEVRVKCPDCSWEHGYPDAPRATKALNGHKSQCRARKAKLELGFSAGGGD